ncbi:MAG: LytTR family DNA-binding domain-containing protein [Clostridiales bacterium]|nr:LytTR family DNA-binding domain-containing protein [Clostridiales bacterium]
MRLALCDNDKGLLCALKPIIYQYANTHRFEMVIDEFNSGEDFLQSDAAYDMVFLDYKMGGVDGLHAARELRVRNAACTIIFMTNYPQFVYEAFEVNTFRFFEKPLDAAKIHAALDDYFRRYGNDYPILLRHEGEVKQVDTGDIVFLEALRKRCRVHLQDKQLYCAKTMSVISDWLPENHFYKVNRAFIINFNYVASYDNEKILMKNGETVPVSRRFFPAFRIAFREYAQRSNPFRMETRDAKAVDS